MFRQTLSGRSGPKPITATLVTIQAGRAQSRHRTRLRKRRVMWRVQGKLRGAAIGIGVVTGGFQIGQGYGG